MNIKSKIKVLLVDDHDLFRAGIKALFKSTMNQECFIEVIGEVRDGGECLQESIRLRPDVVLLDVNLPTIDGIIVAQEISYHLPNTKVIALSADTCSKTVLDMVKAGVKGYVSKTVGLGELVTAIKTIQSGGTYFSQEASSAMVNSLTGAKEPPSSSSLRAKSPDEVLTRREREILRLVTEEKSNQEIANLLFISPRTVETHKRNILLKLKIKNVAGLVKYYIRHTAQ